MAVLTSIVPLSLLLMLLLLFIILLLACKPWRFFPRSFPIRPIKVEDLERPLVSDEFDLLENQTADLERHSVLEGSCLQNEGYGSPRAHGLVFKQRVSPAAPNSVQGESLVLDVISDPAEDILVGQTLKRPLKNYLSEEQNHSWKEDASQDTRIGLDDDKIQEILPNEFQDQRSCLTLEIISGPARGLRCTIQSESTSRLPLTLGRVSPSDLVLKDTEVSGKHAMINWNSNRLKWELVDMGSLNGTLLNSQPVHHPDTGSRHWGNPIELANGDVITLGTTSKVYVQITSKAQSQVPFRFGIASDPMALRRGGKKLPMEDVCFYQWPLHGVDKFGLFGICDGHGGPEAAKSASKILPETVAGILSDSQRRERVLSHYDASDVLKDAFCQTEASLNHHYEGCTATVLLVWEDGQENFFAQCANVGDSACIASIGGEQFKLTEDHRISSSSERLRINGTGEPLKDGETRLCGLNLARMLGDKFLKQQDPRFISEPYISRVLHIDQGSRAFALLASDGLWDVVSIRKAAQLVLQMRDRCGTDKENSAEKIAYFLLSEARTQRTKDNTSIIYIEFDPSVINSPCKFDS